MTPPDDLFGPENLMRLLALVAAFLLPAYAQPPTPDKTTPVTVWPTAQAVLAAPQAAPCATASCTPQPAAHARHHARCRPHARKEVIRIRLFHRVTY